MKVVYAHRRRLENLVSQARSIAVAQGSSIKTSPLLMNEMLDHYNEYLSGLKRSIAGSNFASVAAGLNKYRAFVKAREAELYTPKSKYYSSVLEEFPVLLLEERVRLYLEEEGLASDGFVLGSVECRIGYGMSPDCEDYAEKKCIDFCLAHKNKTGDFIPLVGFEVKKYLDKTMFGTVLETAGSLSRQRPKTVYGFIVEDEARSLDTVENSPIHETEFLLSGRRRQGDALFELLPDKIADMDTSLATFLRKNIGFFAKSRRSRLGIAAPVLHKAPTVF